MRVQIARLMLLVLVLGILISPTIRASNMNNLEREYLIKQAGSLVGTASVQIQVKDDSTLLQTITKYPDLGVEVASEYLFTGNDFPKTPSSYSFSIISGGTFDINMTWKDELKYSMSPLLMEESLPIINVLALDNNLISDYMTTTWLFDSFDSKLQHSNLVIPTQITAGVLPMTIEYIGEEVVGEYQTDHFQVNIGVLVDLWVESSNRSLVKLHIPMQAYEIVASDLQEETGANRVFKDFGGCDFYEEEIIWPIDNGSLSGTLSIPKQPTNQMPGIVLVAGSGPTDRDGNSYVMLGSADYLKEIAHYLASRGIVVLRYDKRGVGLSKGPITSFDDYISDVSSMVDALKTLEIVNHEKVYIIGHSEGAWLASEVALIRDDLAGISLLAGAGYPYFETIKRQLTTQANVATAMGMFDQDLTMRVNKALDDMYVAIINQKNYDVKEYQLPDEFNQVINTFVFQADLIKNWLITDPAQVLSQVKVPVLIIQGSADSQINVADAYLLAEALPDNQVELHIIDDLDHIMKLTKGESASYVDPDRRVEPIVLEVIENWILK